MDPCEDKMVHPDSSYEEYLKGCFKDWDQDRNILRTAEECYDPTTGIEWPEWMFDAEW